MRILLSAFACDPEQGSEPQVGWQWALGYTKLGHEVTVLTQTRNQAPIARSDPLPGCMRMIYYAPPGPLAGLRSWLPLQIYHLIWQYTAYRFARRERLHEAHDLVHHLTFCTIRQPSFMGRLPLPFVLGPVAGGEFAPWRLRRGYGMRGWLVDLARDAANALTRLDPVTRTALRAARIIYVTSRDTLRLVPKERRDKASVRLQIGIDAGPLDPPAPARPISPGKLRLLFAGRLLHWKGLHLGLEALAILRRRGIDVRLTVAGDGPEMARWKGVSERLGIQGSIDWTGWLDRERMRRAYAEHDAFLFPSLHESGGLVILEAMAAGLPVVCLDIGGPGVIVDHTCGRAIATAGHTAVECSEAMADALQALVDDPDLHASLGKGALARARSFAWSDVVASAARDIEVRIGPFASGADAVAKIQHA